MENRKIREIYDYDMIENDEFSLQKWYNMVMDKTPAELTVGDVCRMLRQKIFSVVAIGRAIEILEGDPFAGELFDGQLMENLYAGKEKYLCRRYDDIEKLLVNAELKALAYSWADEGSKEDYLKTIAAFSQRIAAYKAKAAEEVKV